MMKFNAVLACIIVAMDCASSVLGVKGHDSVFPNWVMLFAGLGWLWGAFLIGFYYRVVPR